MSTRKPLPRHYTHPKEVIAGVISAIEPDLDAAIVERVIASCVTSTVTSQKLGGALALDPTLLTSGRPEGPFIVQALIEGLIDAGAVNVVRLRCARCGGQKTLKNFDENGQRVCPSCRIHLGSKPCTGCGRVRHVANRDRAGRPFCRMCWPAHIDGPSDPIEFICDAVNTVQPNLDRGTIRAAVRSVAATQTGQRKLAVAMQANPNLLSGQAHLGPPKLPPLVDKLIAAGADKLVSPKCPICHENRPLEFKHEDQRCCKTCYARSMRKPCDVCGTLTGGTGRDAQHRLLCTACWRKDPARFEQCTRCGEMAFIVSRAGGQNRCKRCYEPPTATCSRCGKTRPCFSASTDNPLCASCVHYQRPLEPCATCGKTRVVNRRREDGSPLCSNCGPTPKPCARCGKVKRVKGRSASGEPLCRPCYNKDSIAKNICAGCGALERLRRRGLCDRCASTELVTDLLRSDGGIQPHIVPVLDALLAAEPTGIADWLEKPERRDMLRSIAAAPAPLTHDFLDGLDLPFLRVAGIRAGLVANGVLPARDERMIRLQRWVPTQLARLSDPTNEKLVRSFANWHHLRRLRKQRGVKLITEGQAQLVRREIKAAVDLLVWLADRNVTLANCTHTRLDEWLTDGPAGRYEARAFVLWSQRNRHCPKGLEIPITPDASAIQVLTADDRWIIVRRLLHDESIDIADRVAGLLLLLFAQPLSRVAHLTVDQVSPSGDAITFGEIPLSLPPPLDALINRLREERPRRAVIGRYTDNPWLFPGWSGAGTPATATHLARRLKTYGIPARSARNATMMELANQLPTTAISRLLGVSISTAMNWSVESGNSRARYAAVVATRRRQAHTAADADANT